MKRGTGPYHIIGINPVEVVKYDIDTRTTTTVVHDGSKTYNLPRDLRGGTQVYPIGNGRRMTFTHEVDLTQDTFCRKDGHYNHRVIVWDDEWNMIHHTKDFHFLGNSLYILFFAISSSNLSKSSSKPLKLRTIIGDSLNISKADKCKNEPRLSKDLSLSPKTSVKNLVSSQYTGVLKGPTLETPIRSLMLATLVVTICDWSNSNVYTPEDFIVVKYPGIAIL